MQSHSEIDRTLLAIAGLNPFVDYNSASRLQMYAAHLGQKLVTSSMTEKYIFTGMEQEFGKYTFSVKMPCDAYIIAVIPKYRPSMGDANIAFSPLHVVIYEDIHTKEVGYITLPLYSSYHSHFGFAYKQKEAMRDIVKGKVIEKGTIILDSPGVTKSGNYMYGKETNVAFMSIPGASEDGIVVSESFAKSSSFCSYETKVVEWGKQRLALNLYGDEKNYKIFPDIGDSVREDSLLMALRNIKPEMYPIRNSLKDLMQVNEVFDRRYYTDSSGGRIIDIRVDTNIAGSDLSPVNQQLEKYINETKRFYDEIYKEYSELVRERKDGLLITPAFHSLIVECLTMYGAQRGKVTKMYRKAPLDDFRVQFTIEYQHRAYPGFKFTSGDGGSRNCVL